MKKLILLFLLISTSLFATDRITISITVTNLPTDGNKLYFNTENRTWKTNVSSASTQMAISNNIPTAASNLFTQVGSYPFDGPVTLTRISNGIKLTGRAGLSMVSSNSGNWAQIVAITNTSALMYGVNVPMGNDGNSIYIASQVVDGINKYATNSIASASDNTRVLINNGTATNLSMTTNGFFIGTSHLYKDSNDFLDGNNQNGTQILMISTNGNTFHYSPQGNFAGFQLIQNTGLFGNNSIIRLQGNSSEGQMGFGQNTILAANSWTFNQQVFVTNALTVMGGITQIGKNPVLFMNRTINGGGAEGTWMSWQDDITGNNWSFGQTTNVAAHFSIRSGSVTPYTGVEEFGIDVGQVSISNNFYVGGNFLYSKGLSFTETNNGVLTTNYVVYGNGVVTNYIHDP